MAYNNAKDLSEIALFVESIPMDPTKLLGYLREKMPAYMIPFRVVFDQAFQINNSEKIDRKN